MEKGLKQMTESQSTTGGFFKRGKHWPFVIVGMLLFHATLILGTIAVVSARHDLYVEPDYYAKAIDWDNQREMREMADKMGWTVDIALSPTEQTQTPRSMLVSIMDRNNQPIDGALVELEAVHPAHANNRINLVLIGEGQGHYQKTIAINEPGFWKLNLSIRHQGIEAIVMREIKVN